MPCLGLQLVWFVMSLIILQTQESHQTEFQDTAVEFMFHNVYKVWRKGITGKGVVVGVVDDGVSYIHKDLKENYNKDLSFNFVSDDRDAIAKQPTSHGTKCAGIIAAKRHGECRTGFAYNATIAGLKIINGSFANDESSAAGLRHEKNKIHIYSNSWGPIDNGFTINGPGPLVRQALEDGAKQGRNGRGSIFVFSSGNGGIYDDSCAFDGYVNNIYTIAIGVVSKSGSISGYAESCSSIMAATYGDEVQTCDSNGRCASRFARSSAAAATASGILALLLDANNQLTWRDVQHLIVRTSNPKREITGGNGWIINGAGLMVHPTLGFGIMDAEKLVDEARNNWKEVPHQTNCSVEFSNGKLRKSFHRDQRSFIINTMDNVECLKIKYIEHVQVEVSLNFAPRGLLKMYLISPQKTKSQLIYQRVYDALTGRKTYKDLVITSIHFWGENVTEGKGKWRIMFDSVTFNRGAQGTISKFKITFYGTEHDPIAHTGLPKGIKACRYKDTRKNIWKGYGSHCCGTMGLYDNNLVRCCKKKKLVEKKSLCGNSTFDKCTQICCAGNVYQKIEGITSCCGSETYNTKTEICCNKRREQKHYCAPIYDYRKMSWSTQKYKHVVRCTYDGGVPYTQYEVCPDCKDNVGYTRCLAWKNRKFCNHEYLKNNCAKTCGHC